MRVALVGMPGCGKSSVGRHLARQLGLAFVDSDAELERRFGCSIKDYFAAHGEAAFRDAEEAAIGELCAGPDALIATGGGAVLREANRAALHRGCTVFYLRASPDELFRRLRHDRTRPLLQVADPLARLRELYRDRDPLYRRTAHYVIEAARPSVPALINMVKTQLELAGLVPDLTVELPVDEPPPTGT